MKHKKVITAAVCVLLAVSIISAGGYAVNMFGLLNEGNKSEYSAQDAPVFDTALKGKTVIFLGSSVTYGFGSKGESFVEYFEKQYGVNAVKEAVSGTTLADISEKSYVSRLKKIDTSIKADAFVCQLSTNDAAKNIPLGETGACGSYDTSTVAGAIEYIIDYVKSAFNCPVIFYTGTKYDSENYEQMVSLLHEIAVKHGVGVIDLWNSPVMNAVSEEDYKLYMTDPIHPSRAGYRDWWTPVMAEYLIDYLGG